MPVEVGDRLRWVVAADDHEPPLRGQAVLPGERGDRHDVEPQPAGVRHDHRPFADHDVEPAVAERIERLAERSLHLAVERFAEERGEFLVVALGVALHARARELLGQRIHHREPQRLGGLADRAGQEDRGDEPRRARHDRFSMTSTRPVWTSR